MGLYETFEEPLNSLLIFSPYQQPQHLTFSVHHLYTLDFIKKTINFLKMERRDNNSMRKNCADRGRKHPEN